MGVRVVGELSCKWVGGWVGAVGEQRQLVANTANESQKGVPPLSLCSGNQSEEEENVKISKQRR